VKVVINADYGGFNLSDEAIELYAKYKGLNLIKEETNHGSIYYKGAEWFNDRDIDRKDSTLVRVVQELGEKANGFCAKLKIVNIPVDVQWEVVEYDGLEHIAEKARKWF
jgi:hypothetical protein